MHNLIDTLTWPVLGGALLGISAAALMLFNGRVAGVSGILGSALLRSDGERGWRWAFLLGLVASGLVISWQAGPSAFENTTGLPLVAVAAAGLLVGFGASLGSGCTAGHGICGLARLSPRSLASVLTFITTGAVVTFVVRHVVGA
jgi:uncharacterized membrane protein YedE/YeeE